MTSDQWAALAIICLFLIAWVIWADREAEREFRDKIDRRGP